MGCKSTDHLAFKLESLSRLLSGRVTPFQAYEQISRLTPEQLDQALRVVSAQERRLSERQASIFDAEGDREEVSVTLSDLQYFCVDEILAKFEGGDVVEIYDRNFVQLYHNWIFHYYCSYDLLTIVTEPIWKLYSRPQAINDCIGHRAQEIMDHAQGPERWNVPVHYLKEAMIQTPRVFEIDFQWICPVRDHSGKAVAFVSTLKCLPNEIQVV